jgi:hypothetical protein
MLFASGLKRCSLICLFLTSLASPLVHAEIISYDFTATVYRIDEYLGAGYVTVESSVVPGALLANGNTVKGHFFYDTATPEHPEVLLPATVMYSAPGFQTGMQFTVMENGLAFQATGNSEDSYVVITNNPAGSGGHDEFQYSSWTGLSSAGDSQSAYITLDDPSANVFHDLVVPSSLSLADFASATFMSTWFMNGDTQEATLFAHLDSLTATVTAIPEPSTGALFLGGLLIFGWTLRRKGNSRSTSPI